MPIDPIPLRERIVDSEGKLVGAGSAVSSTPQVGIWTRWFNRMRRGVLAGEETAEMQAFAGEPEHDRTEASDLSKSQVLSPHAHPGPSEEAIADLRSRLQLDAAVPSPFDDSQLKILLALLAGAPGPAESFVIADTHANRVNYPASAYDKYFYFETNPTMTDRQTIYLSIGGVWRYVAGVMNGTLTDAPSDLTATGDIGFLFHVTTGTGGIAYNHTVRWTGSGWATEGEFGCCWKDFGRAPLEPGWQLSDGTATKYLWISAGVLQEVDVTLPDLTKNVVRVGGTSYSGGHTNWWEDLTPAKPTSWWIVAATAPHNLLDHSEQLDDPLGGFVGYPPPAPPFTITPNVVLDPNGNLTAEQIDVTFPGISYLWKAFVAVVGRTCCFSIWLKSIAGTYKLKLSIFMAPIWEVCAIGPELTLTTDWQRYDVHFTPPLEAGRLSSYSLCAAIGGTQDADNYGLDVGSFSAWGAQVNLGDAPAAYLQTTDRPIIQGWEDPSGGSVTLTPGATSSAPLGGELTVLPYFRR